MNENGKTLRNDLLKFNVQLLKNNGIEPTPLKNGMILIDMEATFMDNSKTEKEGVFGSTIIHEICFNHGVY